MTTSEKIDWLRSMDKVMISPRELAMVTGGDAYAYNICAKQGRLHLPHEWHGRNLRIWKQPVINILEGGVCYTNDSPTEHMATHEKKML